MAKSPGMAAALPFSPPSPHPVNTTWAAPWWIKRPMRFPWRNRNFCRSWTWRAGLSVWMPCTRRMKRPARSSWKRGATTCSPSKTISPLCGPISKRKSPLPKRIFPPEHPTATQARTQEINKGRAESRAIRTAPVSPEDVGFPLASQAARLLRQTQGRKNEEVALITSAPVSLLPARLWLRLNRQGWGIESGLHQRLDISYNDDRCRVQNDNGLWVLGMFRRLANSLFVEWSRQQRRPERVTTTSFQTLMAENHRAAAMRLVLSKRPSLKNLS